jgi:ATP-binding cassette subfamily B multidrug efflux pump
LLRLFRFLKPYTARILFIITLFLMQALVDLALPTFMAEIVNKGIIKGDVHLILNIGIKMTGLAAAGVLCALIAGLFSSRTALGFSRKVRSEIFTRVESFSLREFDAIGGSSLITRTTNDVQQVQQSLIIMLSMMMRAPLMCVGGIIMAVSRDAQLSLVLAVAIPVLAGFIFLVQRTAIPLFREIQKKLDALNRVIREKLDGIREVRAFNMETHEQKRFDAANTGLTDTSLKMATLMSIMMPAIMTIMNFTMLAITWFGGLRVEAGKMQVGDIMAFIQYVMLILFSLMMVSMLFILVPRSQVSAVRINEVLDMEPDIRDPDAPKNPEPAGKVEFRNVSFKYKGAEQPALSGVSFSAGPGETTAIIGSTGSGKTTLASLLLRFYDADSGSVLVDGVDVREYSQRDLRSRIGYVPQQALLFTGTVADNVGFGGAAGEADIKTAMDISQSTEFVEQMPDKTGSLLAQGGKNLSGGQKQRLAIARAIAKKPVVYLFDDSFSALDFKTDAALRRALKKQTGHAAVIIIAQRVATVLDADRIVVLDEGKVCGTGRHNELMKTCGVYREIVSSQLSAEELA